MQFNVGAKDELMQFNIGAKDEVDSQGAHRQLTWLGEAASKELVFTDYVTNPEMIVTSGLVQIPK